MPFILKMKEMKLAVSVFTFPRYLFIFKIVTNIFINE